jgi:hypothetical protein
MNNSPKNLEQADGNLDPHLVVQTIREMPDVMAILSNTVPAEIVEEGLNMVGTYGPEEALARVQKELAAMEAPMAVRGKVEDVMGAKPKEPRRSGGMLSLAAAAALALLPSIGHAEGKPGFINITRPPAGAAPQPPTSPPTGGTIKGGGSAGGGTHTAGTGGTATPPTQPAAGPAATFTDAQLAQIAKIAADAVTASKQHEGSLPPFMKDIEWGYWFNNLMMMLTILAVVRLSGKVELNTKKTKKAQDTANAANTTATTAQRDAAEALDILNRP